MLPLDKTRLQKFPSESQDDFKSDHEGALKGRFVTKKPTNLWDTIAKIGMSLIPIALIPVYLHQQGSPKNKEPSPTFKPKPHPLPRDLTVYRPIPEVIKEAPPLNIIDNIELKNDELSLNRTQPLFNIGLCCLIVCLGIKIFHYLCKVQHQDEMEREIKQLHPPKSLSKSNVNSQEVRDEDLQKRLEAISTDVKTRLEKIEIETAKKLAEIGNKIELSGIGSKDILNSFDLSSLSPSQFADICIQKIKNEEELPKNTVKKLLNISVEHALAFASACLDADHYIFITRATFQEFQAKSLNSAFAFGVACVGKNDYICRSNVEQASITFRQIDKQNNFTTDYTLRFAKECAKKNAYDAIIGPYNFLREKHFKSAQEFIDWCKENSENATCLQIEQLHNSFYQKNDEKALVLS